MTHGVWEIVGRDDQEIPMEKSIGEAVRIRIQKEGLLL